MDALALTRFALCDYKIRPTFGGVFARDTLPWNIGSYRSFIVNTDPAHKKGQHWQTLYFDEKGKCYFFCSYGLKPTLNIESFAKRNSDFIEWNPHQFQLATTSTCGLFSLYFLYNITRGLLISKLEPSNLYENERIIQRFARQKLNLSTMVNCLNKQVCQARYKYNV